MDGFMSKSFICSFFPTFCTVWQGSLWHGPNTGPWSFTVKCSSLERMACSSSETIRNVPVCSKDDVRKELIKNSPFSRSHLLDLSPDITCNPMSFTSYLTKDFFFFLLLQVLNLQQPWLQSLGSFTFLCEKKM